MCTYNVLALRKGQNISGSSTSYCHDRSVLPCQFSRLSFFRYPTSDLIFQFSHEPFYERVYAEKSRHDWFIHRVWTGLFGSWELTERFTLSWEMPVLDCQLRNFKIAEMVEFYLTLNFLSAISYIPGLFTLWLYRSNIEMYFWAIGLSKCTFSAYANNSWRNKLLEVVCSSRKVVGINTLRSVKFRKFQKRSEALVNCKFFGRILIEMDQN